MKMFVLKNRVLDLRSPEMNHRIVTRSKISSTIRNYLDENDFHEIETPILTRATPEGQEILFFQAEFSLVNSLPYLSHLSFLNSF